MGLTDYFIKDLETRDTHANPSLRTHYYKCEYAKAKDEILRLLNEKKFTVKNIDDNYGEIFVETPSFHMIISIRRALVLNVSIDIKVSVYSVIGAKKPHKIVNWIYAYCDKKLPFVGVGLQPGM